MNVSAPPGSGAEKTPSSGGTLAPGRPLVKPVGERHRHRALALTGKLFAPGASEDDVMAFVTCLADLFGDVDPKLSQEKYEETAWNLVHRRIPLNLVMESIEAACDKDPKKLRKTRGSYFMAVLKAKLKQWRRSAMERPAEIPSLVPTPLLDAVEARETAPELAEVPNVAESPDPRSVVASLASNLAAGPKVPL